VAVLIGGRINCLLTSDVLSPVLCIANPPPSFQVFNASHPQVITLTDSHRNFSSIDASSRAERSGRFFCSTAETRLT
jgi:hypothetical protein